MYYIVFAHSRYITEQNTYTAIIGDFNINLLQIYEREKYIEVFYMIYTSFIT